MLLKKQEKDNKIKAMYNSSTILASIYNTDTNELTVIFKNGGQYKYAPVTNTDYVRFESADSQGIVLNSHIKKYTFEKLAPVDTTVIIKEIETLKADDNKNATATKSKAMLDAMIRLTAGYVATDAVNPTLLANVEKAIAEYHKVTTPVAAPTTQVVS
jgi:hypothetical protein